jgi:hypothetical protein
MNPLKNKVRVLAQEIAGDLVDVAFDRTALWIAERLARRQARAEPLEPLDVESTITGMPRVMPEGARLSRHACPYCGKCLVFYRVEGALVRYTCMAPGCPRPEWARLPQEAANYEGMSL